MKKRLRLVLSVVIVVTILLTSFLLFFNPSTGVTTDFQLSEVNSGYSYFDYNNTTYVSPWVNLNITFSVPLGLDPARLIFQINAPKGETPFTWVFYKQSFNSVELPFYSAFVPHWIAVRNSTIFNSMVTGNITNPDGNNVGGYPVIIPYDGFTWVNGDSVVQSGAMINLTFESTIHSLQGFTVTASYIGAHGTASVILTQG